MGLYDKYFIQYGITTPIIPTEMRPVISRIDDEVAKGSFFYLVHWMMPFDPNESFFSGVRDPKSKAGELWRNQYGDLADVVSKHDMAGHPPHIHKDAELLFHIGTNPDDPMDLGGEVQMYMGQEMEKHAHEVQCRFYVVLEGSGRVWIGNEQRETEKGMVIWVPSGLAH